MSNTNSGDWHKEHELDYWKRRALNLELENVHLHKRIREFYACMIDTDKSLSIRAPSQLLSPQHEKTEGELEWGQTTKSSSHRGRRKKKRAKVKRRNISNRRSSKNETPLNPVLVISEEFRAILQDNMRYRYQRDQTKQKNDTSHNSSQSIIDEIENFHTERKSIAKTMYQLYGEYGKRIFAYELAMQMQFDNAKSNNGYPYWPAVSLKA